jgi:hypothetical protein
MPAFEHWNEKQRLARAPFSIPQRGKVAGHHERAQSSDAKMTPAWREDYSFVITLRRRECAKLQWFRGRVRCRSLQFRRVES